MTVYPKTDPVWVKVSGENTTGMVGSRQVDLQGFYVVAPSNDYQRLIWRRLVEDGGQPTIRNLLHAVFATEYAEQEDYILDEDGRTLSASASAQRIITDWLASLIRFRSFTYELLQRALSEQVIAMGSNTL